MKCFFRTQNALGKSREGNLLIFSKVKQTIVTGDFSTKQEKREKNQPDVFKLQPVASWRSAANTLDYSLKELVG